MQWNQLNKEEHLREIIVRSSERHQVIFKHSTRCSISSVARARLEKAKPPFDVDFHFLDLINYRSLSNKIAETFGVNHESPQVLIIKDGTCVFDESHMGISMADITDQVMSA
jgi:bacillithiol system protein YtxJ